MGGDKDGERIWPKCQSSDGLRSSKRLRLVRSWGHQGSGSATNQLGQMESTAAGCNNFCSVAVEPSGFRLFVTFLVLTEADANRHHTSFQPAVSLLNLRFQRGKNSKPCSRTVNPDTLVPFLCRKLFILKNGESMAKAQVSLRDQNRKKEQLEHTSSTILKGKR